MRVLVAPDKFKGTLTAEAAAAAIASAVAVLLPGATVDPLPLSDGGEGFASCLLRHLGGTSTRISVTGPAGPQVSMDVAFLHDGRAVVEMAQASGLGLMGEPDALRAHSIGTGEAISWAASRAKSVLVGVGGSASTDGGTGAAAALGWRFLDRAGRALPPGGGSLVHLARIAEPTSRSPIVVSGACDVANPLLGPEGAARVFAAQKGADHHAVAVLESGLENLSRRLEADLGVDPAHRPMAGAGGGMGAGLAAFFGAALVQGSDLVAEVVGLHEAIASSDLVITGEGTLDASGTRGKVPGKVADICRATNVPCLLVAGSIGSPEAARGFAAATSLEGTVGLQAALHSPEGSLEAATRELLNAYL